MPKNNVRWSFSVVGCRFSAFGCRFFMVGCQFWLVGHVMRIGSQRQRMGVLFAPWLQASWTQSPGGAEQRGAGGIRRLDVSGIISSGASNNRVAIGFERCIISAHGSSVSGDGAHPWDVGMHRRSLLRQAAASVRPGCGLVWQSVVMDAM